MKVPRKLNDVLHELVSTAERSAASVDELLDSATHAGLELRTHAEALMTFADELFEWAKEYQEDEDDPETV